MIKIRKGVVNGQGVEPTGFAYVDCFFETDNLALTEPLPANKLDFSLAITHKKSGMVFHRVAKKKHINIAMGFMMEIERCFDIDFKGNTSSKFRRVRDELLVCKQLFDDFLEKEFEEV